MSKRSGDFVSFLLAVGANNSVIPYNARRRYLFIGATQSTSINVVFNAATIASAIGIRMSNVNNGVELRGEDCGDLVTQPVSVWNSGAANSAFCWVEGLDNADI